MARARSACMGEEDAATLGELAARTVRESSTSRMHGHGHPDGTARARITGGPPPGGRTEPAASHRLRRYVMAGGCGLDDG